MIQPVYNLTLTRSPDGDYVAKGSETVGGNYSLSALPLGAAFSDVFRKDRAPTPRELIQQLVGTAYACATLNADLVASA